MSKAIDIIFIAAGLIVATAVLSAPFTGSQRAAEPLPLAVTGVEAEIQQESEEELLPWLIDPRESLHPVLRYTGGGPKPKIRRVVQN